MTTGSARRRRNGWRAAFDIVLILLGLFILGHTVVATRVSVLTVGWCVLVAGIVALLAAMVRIGHPSFWFGAASGALSTSVGLLVVRFPDTAAVTLTLIAGAIFLAGGILRLVTATNDRGSRTMLIVSGSLYVALGLFVLSDISSASYNLLGRVIGLQIMLDGISLLLVGRARVGMRDRHHAGARPQTPEPDPAERQPSATAST